MLLIGNCSAIFAPLRQLFRLDPEGTLKVGLALSRIVALKRNKQSFVIGGFGYTQIVFT
jgi:hypothetical protein